MKIFNIILAGFTISTTLWSSDVYATNKDEIIALSKILSLSKDIPHGPVDMYVLYNPENHISEGNKLSIKSITGEGFSGPKHNIKAIPITVKDLDKITQKSVVYITQGLKSEETSPVIKLTTEKGILTVTDDLELVRQKQCVLGINVNKTVTVIIHNELYNDTNLSFDASFEFLVKEI